MKTHRNNLFNSPFETSLRILLLLSVNDNKYYSLEKILCIDFITCYSEDYGFNHHNLHGINHYKLSEISNRRKLIQTSIKDLVVKGLITPIINNGYIFAISKQGENYINSLTSTYSREYKEIALDVINKYGKEDDENVLTLIRSKTIK